MNPLSQSETTLDGAASAHLASVVDAAEQMDAAASGDDDDDDEVCS